MSDYLISSLEAMPLNLPLKEPFSIATGKQDEVNNVLIKVTLSNGVIGLGEAAPFPAVSGETQRSTIAAIEKIKHLIVKSDVRYWKKISSILRDPLRKEPAALCGLEMALADALAKSYGIPLGVLFGGASEVLRTDMTIPASDKEHAAASARDIVGRGISIIKIKTSGKDVDFDFERIKAVKESAPDASLIVDGNCGYSLSGALELARKLHHHSIPLMFFEQPLPPSNWEELAVFSKESGMKVAADESARTPQDVLRIAELKCAHVVNIKLMKSGLLDAIKMAEISKAGGLELMIGGMVETILSMSFSAHFAAGIGGFTYADLDTPMFIKTHPFKGGFTLVGDKVQIDYTKAGHSVELA